MPALIFDVDGTLAETEELHRAAFNKAFADAGLDWFWDQNLYGELLKITGGKERIAHHVESAGLAIAEPVAELAARLHAAKTQHYVKGVESGALSLNPGVAALIAAAQEKGIRLAIATTTSRENVESLLLHTLGAEHGFEVIACGDMVAAKKPAPDVYLLALEMLGLPASECVALEDSANGLRAAKAAGLRCVITPALYTSAEDFAAADLQLTDLRDARPVFELLGQA